MTRISFLATILFIVILAGCSGPKIVAPSLTTKEVAVNATNAGNYDEAVKAWKTHFDEQTLAQIPGSDFALAAQMAFKSGDNEQAVKWFDQARYKNFADAEMYKTLAAIFRKQQNISKELSALEYYKANFEGDMNDVNVRLFELYQEVNLMDEALIAWDGMNEVSKNDIINLKPYFKINKSLEKTELCDSLALVILDKEPLNVDALEWVGKKYYWQGENRYQEEMEKYNNNKTNKQYKILLNELEKSTADFKKALPYFEKLWKIEPGEKYASFFANIYARFGDESKVNYYKKYMK
jgi:tetratricopeptide (TPR) repeat protein